jgi:hypothetical protein
MMPSMNPAHSQHVYEIRPRRDHRDVAAISDALPFIIALIVGGVLVSILLYFGSFLVTRRQDARLRSPPAQRKRGVDLISDVTQRRENAGGELTARLI